MPTVITEIAEWGLDLPYWEQRTLDKIIAGESFQDEDYDQLLQFLLEDENLAELSGTRPAPRFHRRISEEIDTTRKIRLKQITNLQNINALIPNQTLTFGDSLTIIFGANGSGKSGYARVIGSAGFTRGDRDVLPDISAPHVDSAVLSADLLVTIGDENKLIHYQLGKPCPDLASFYIFDSTSVKVHMSEQTPLSFSPAGLSFLTQLSEETDRVRERLNGRVKACCEPCEVINAFQGESEVSQILSNIGSDTDLKQLKSLAILSVEEKKRRSELSKLIANVELDEINARIGDLKDRKKSFSNFRERLENALKVLGDDKTQTVNEDISHYQRCQAIVSSAGAEKFSSPSLKSAGSRRWRDFIEAANFLAKAESLSGKPYPQEGDFCLLCQQPLTPASRKLIIDLWDYLKEQSQANLVAAGSILRAHHEDLDSIDLFEAASDVSTPYKYLGEQNPELLQKVQHVVQACHQRYSNLIAALDTHQPASVDQLPENCLEEIDARIKSIDNKLNELEQMNLEETVRKWEVEKLALDHRALLGQLYPQIEEYIKQRKWAQAASTVGGNTKHITVKHNALFKKLVTD